MNDYFLFYTYLKNVFQNWYKVKDENEELKNFRFFL